MQCPKHLENAWSLVGGLSAPSKMPGYAYSTPARKCQAGSKLRAVEGSTCKGCYAMKGRYIFGNVQGALDRRFNSLEHPGWVDAMVALIDHFCADVPWFRWHDSGDIQSLEHLERIAAVCQQTPNVHHWLPTREYRFVALYLAKHGSFPSNLNVRLSAHMVDGPLPSGYGLPTSGVTRDHDQITCPAPSQGNQCGSCRQCWESAVANVNYGKH